MFPVDSTIATAAASSTAPRTTGSPFRAMCMMIVSDAARPTMLVWAMRSGNAARPVMATSASVVSISTTPTIMPITAFRAAPSSLAEKNFWYIPLSPSNNRNVGKDMPTTQMML